MESPRELREMYMSSHPHNKLSGSPLSDFLTPKNEGLMAGFPPTYNAWHRHAYVMGGLGPGWGQERSNSATTLGLNQFVTMTAVTLVNDDYGMLLSFTAANPSIATVSGTNKFPAAYAATYGNTITFMQRIRCCFTTSFPNFAMGIGTNAQTGIHAATPADFVGIKSDLTGTDKLVGIVQGGGAGASNQDIGVLGTTFGVGVVHDIGLRFTYGATAAECSGAFYYRNYDRAATAAAVDWTVTPFTAAQLAELLEVNDRLTAYLEMGRTDSAVTTVPIRNYTAMCDLQ